MADLLPAQTVPSGYDPSIGPDPGAIAPGQEELVKEFLSTQGEDGVPVVQPDPGEPEAEADDLIGGKFRSQEDLLKAYQELERKQSQDAQPDPDPRQPQGYTDAQAVEQYGEELVNQFREAGLDMKDLMWKVDTGVDVSDQYDAMAAAAGMPRHVIENYVARNRNVAEAEAAPMTAADEAALKNEVGGPEAFTKLSQWAKEGGGLTEAELADYNAVVDSGNKQAIRWALKAIQAKANGPATTEPKLIRGQAPVTEPAKFNSQAEMLEAMNARDSRGRKKIEVDEAYQQKFAALLNNSDVI